jgi:hypothetical protein
MVKGARLFQRVRRLLRVQKRRADQYMIIAEYWRSRAVGAAQ